MVGRAAQLTVRNHPKRRDFTLTQVNHVLGKPLRKGREHCHSSGRVNRRIQSHPPISDQTARGLAGRLLNRWIQLRVRQCSPFLHPSPPPPPFPLRLSQFWRTTACAFPKYSPHLPGTKREGGDERARHSQAAARHNCTALCPLPPPSVLPLVLLQYSALRHSARYPNTRTSH